MPKIIVKGFDENIEEDLVNLIFRAFGPLKSVIRHNVGSFVVDYEAIENAKTACKILNNKNLKNGNKLISDMFYNKNKRIVIKNQYKLEEIERILSNYGKIYNIKTTPLHIYVDFYSEEDIKSILNAKIRTPDGKNYLKIKREGFEAARNDQTLIVYNLSIECKEEDLIKKFKKYGNISSCKLEKYKAFINYENPDSVKKAFKKMNNRVFLGKKLFLKLKTDSNHSF